MDSSTFVVLPWYARSRCTPRFRHCACHMWLYHVIPQQHFNGLQCLKLRPLVISFHRLFLSLVFAGADWRVDAKETQMTFYSPKCLFWNLDWENIWRLPILNRCDSFWRLCVSPWVGRRDFGNAGLSNKHQHLSSGTGCNIGITREVHSEGVQPSNLRVTYSFEYLWISQEQVPWERDLLMSPWI